MEEKKVKSGKYVWDDRTPEERAKAELEAEIKYWRFTWAGMALQGLLGNQIVDGKPDHLIDVAFLYADKMTVAAGLKESE